MAQKEAKQKETKTATKTSKKASIHPEYHQTEVTCACGAKYTIGTSLSDSIRVDLCSKCHPFYTGEQKIVDTENLVSKFEEKAKKAKKDQKSRAERREDKRKARAPKSASQKTPSKELTLKDIMKTLQKGK